MSMLIVGASGQARETAQLARLLYPELQAERAITLVDLSDEEQAIALAASPAFRGMLALGIGRPRQRIQAWSHWRESVPGLWPALLHPRSDIGNSTAIGQGVMIASGVVATCDIHIGDGAMINYNATVGHDVFIDECCVINPSATLAGGVRLGKAVLIGAGANVLEGLTIGDGSMIGAGAVVTRDVLPGSVVVGVPARPLREPS